MHMAVHPLAANLYSVLRASYKYNKHSFVMKIESIGCRAVYKEDPGVISSQVYKKNKSHDVSFVVQTSKPNQSALHPLT